MTIFYTYKNLGQLIKYLKKSNNPFLESISISKLIYFIIHLEPSFYKKKSSASSMNFKTVNFLNKI